MPENKDQTLIEHLTELRKRLIYSLIPFLLAAIASISFAKRALWLLRFPARGVIKELAFFSPQEVAIVYLKIAVFSGLFLSLPIILYQAWKFISPALEEEQKRHVVAFVFWTSLVFFIGSAFGYFGLVPVSLKFLIGLAKGELVPVISISKYISFVLALMLGCGLVFEMPVLIWLLTKLGVVNSGMLRRKRKYAVAAIFIAAALITPTTDPFNMCLLAAPMLILYEISIWISRWNRKQAQ